MASKAALGTETQIRNLKNTEHLGLIYNKWTCDHLPVLNWIFVWLLQSEGKKYCRQRLQVWDFLLLSENSNKTKSNAISISGNIKRYLTPQTTEEVSSVIHTLPRAVIPKQGHRRQCRQDLCSYKLRVKTQSSIILQSEECTLTEETKSFCL